MKLPLKQNLARLGGIFPPVVTPFNRRGDVDEGSFRSNLERYTGIGLAGVVVAGTTGEAPLLTERERLRLTELARRTVSPPELVIAGTGLEGTRQTIRLSREAMARGADLALVVTPGYYTSKMDTPALVAHYRAVADALPRPILVYSIPQCTGVRMAPEAIVALTRHSNIAGLKESSGDLAYARAILRRVPASFSVFSGALTALLGVLRAGGAGGIVVQANFAPDLCVAFYEAFRAGRQRTARELFSRLVPLAREISVKFGTPAVKAAMDLSGFRGGNPRPPLAPASAAERRVIARALSEARSSLAL
jgi:4-hydroxy-2-oxoglutarate aldolase